MGIGQEVKKRRKKKKETKQNSAGERPVWLGQRGKSPPVRIYQVGKNAKEFHTVKKQLRPEREKERTKASNSKKDRGKRRWREKRKEKTEECMCKRVRKSRRVKAD